MTVKELYEWAKKKHVENYDIEVELRSNSYGWDERAKCDPHIDNRTWDSHTLRVVVV